MHNAIALTQIQRQKGRYKALVHDLSEGGEGNVWRAFQELDRLGWVKEVGDEDRAELLAREYVDAVSKGQTALVVSPTHREGESITDSIRARLREQGTLGTDERLVPTLTSASLTEAQRRDPLSYLPTDTLVFHQNARGYTKGQRVSVSDLVNAAPTSPAEAATAAPTPTTPQKIPVNTPGLPFDQAARFDVFRPGVVALSPGDLVRITRNGQTLDKQHALNNGAVYTLNDFTPEGDLVFTNGWTVSKDYGHLAHGYVVTSHASQGRSVDRVFIGQSSRSFPASSPEQFYVSVSRGKRQATIYTDDKVSLLDAVLHSDERLTATELQRHKQREHGLRLIRNQTFEAAADNTRRAEHAAREARERTIRELAAAARHARELDRQLDRGEAVA